jgi:type III restriction enzyme
MLSEGWDAKTVTHIMGLRAFSSQLLCEQVVGRGLRRTSYEVNPATGLFDAEYVNIFGVPFTFLPHETQDGPPPPPPSPKTRIEPVIEKQKYEISWPNVIRIDHTYKPTLKLDMEKVKPLVLDAWNTTTLVEMAPIVEGKPDVTKISEIDLKDLGQKFRQQKIIFETARDIYDQMQPTWKGSKEYLLAQLIRLVKGFIVSDKIQITPSVYAQADVKRRILITLNMNKVVQHIWEAIRFENTESLEPIFDSDKPICSTGDMRTWYTGKPCEYTRRSHINCCVFDSTWEASEAFEFDRNSKVAAWVKNDHLGFEILYIFEGVVRKFWPDFIIKLKTGEFLILETKGQDNQRDKTKRQFLDEWVKAVNSHGGFGKWKWAVSKNPADVPRIIEQAVES